METSRLISDASATAWVLEATGVYFLGIGKCDEAQPRFVKRSRSAGKRATGNIGANRWRQAAEHRTTAAIWPAACKRGASSSKKPKHEAMICNGPGDVTDVPTEFFAWAGKIHEQSVRLLEEALQLFGQNVDRVSEFGTYRLMSLAQLRRADLAAAHKSADAGMKLAIALATPSAYYTFNGYFGVARTYLRLWEDALASDKASLAKLRRRLAVRSTAMHACSPWASRPPACAKG